jgi:hypothetical protein
MSMFRKRLAEIQASGSYVDASVEVMATWAAERRQAVDAAIASARIEGVAISPETLAVMDLYVRTGVADEMVAQVLALHGSG